MRILLYHDFRKNQNIHIHIHTYLPVENIAKNHRSENHNIIITTIIMPTPESAAFLAKKPSVPPTFSGVDYNDTSALKAAQDAIIREQWVKAMMFRLVGKELGKCYHREGVGHLEKCGLLRGMCVFFCFCFVFVCVRKK